MKTKTMYVCKADLDNYKNFIVSEVKDGRMDFEVEIRWKEPKIKIEITESEFDELAKEWDRTPSAREKFNFLKQKLFGVEK